MTARRERGRKKEKTEKERSVLGGRSCTRLGSPGGRAGDSPMAASIPVRSAEELPSLSPGICSLPLHQHEKVMGKNKHKGAFLRQLQCHRTCHKKPDWLSINPPDSPQGPTSILHPTSSQHQQEQAVLPRPPHGHQTGKTRTSSTKHRPSLSNHPGKEKPALGSPFLSDFDLQNHSAALK